MLVIFLEGETVLSLSLYVRARLTYVCMYVFMYAYVCMYIRFLYFINALHFEYY